MNETTFQTAALKRSDATFAAAPRAGMVIIATWLAVVIIAAVLATHAGIFLPLRAKFPPSALWLVLAADTGIIVICIAAWLASSIRAITLTGQTLLIKLTFWTTRFDLVGLRSIGADAQALKGSLRSFGNGGLGAFHGYFWSRRMGKFRAYVTDKNRAVVLRWENKCVVVSPKDTEYFIEEVCKRTGVRREN